MKRNYIFYLILVIGVLGMVSCLGDSGKPQRSGPEVDPLTTVTISASTKDHTLVALAPTFTPIPTITRPNTPTPIPPTPDLILSEEDFGEDHNPLTGELVTDPSILLRRPIAVKISNAPAKYTRPQSGLSQADIVFEHMTEGSITRFTAILYSHTPPNIGPIRSARLIDLEIPAMYDAALAYSGSSIGVSRKLFDSDFKSRILRPHEAGYYRTGENKPYEHTFYAHPAEFWPALEAKGENKKPIFNTYNIFSGIPPEVGQPGEYLNLEYKKFSTIEWQYYEESGRYFRTVDGEAAVDANTGEPISSANVIILFVPHSVDETICEYQVGDRCHAYSTVIHLWGMGQAILLRDGQRFDLFWRRENRNDVITLANRSGEAFPLKIGNSWFQVVPQDYDPDGFLIE